MNLLHAHHTVRRISLLLLAISPLIISSLASGSAYANPSASPADRTTQAWGSNQPVFMPFWINGYPDVGVVNFSLPQGTDEQVEIYSQYPFTLPNPTEVPVNFTILPFPISSSLPSWLSVTTPQSIQVTSAIASNVTLAIEIASGTANGTRGVFELRATYVDPDESTVIQVITIGITANSTVTSPQSIPFSQLRPVPDPADWALGVGVCASNNTGNCGAGVSWSSVTAVKSSFTVPNWSPPSESNSTQTTYITVNAGIAYNFILQVELCQEAAVCSGATTTKWVEGFTTAQPLSGTNGVYYNYYPGTISGGSATTLQIGYSTSYYGDWYAEIGSSQWAIEYYTTTLPSVSSLFNYNQEPFAFESYDHVGSDFNGIYMNVNPATEYYTSSWQNPSEVVIVRNDAGHSSWCGTGFCSIIGTQGTYLSVPSSFLEAGHWQCPNQISNYQIYIGSETQGYLNSCGGSSPGGSNTYDVWLWI
jgi:hypothetical protein